ncbi:MAG: phosphoribosyltransferase [Rhizobiaceae bacterium]
MPLFDDRRDAGRQLLKALPAIEPGRAVVVALPRGGVPVGAVIAGALGCLLDVIIVRKIGAPGQPELAVGAVSDGAEPRITVNGDIARALGLTAKDIARLAERERGELDRRDRLYRAGQPPLDIAGRTVILVDDGIATGATVKSALRLLRLQGPSDIILAVPVAPTETLAELEPEADRVVCLASPEPFIAVGAHYRDFDQTGDEEVVATLARFQ